MHYHSLAGLCWLGVVVEKREMRDETLQRQELSDRKES
jgi:hypothetical protein